MIKQLICQVGNVASLLAHSWATNTLSFSLLKPMALDRLGDGLESTQPTHNPLMRTIRCRANSAHVRQSRPAFGLGFHVKGLNRPLLARNRVAWRRERGRRSLRRACTPSFEALSTNTTVTRPSPHARQSRPDSGLCLSHVQHGSR